MGSGITGDFDLAFEISEHLLSVQVAEQLVGERTFDGGGVRIGAARVEAVDGGGAAVVRIVADVLDGTVTLYDVTTRVRPVVRGLRFQFTLTCPVEVELEGQVPRLRCRFGLATPLAVTWSPQARVTIPPQLGKYGWDWEKFERNFLGALRLALLAVAPPAVPLRGVLVDPEANVFPPTDGRLRVRTLRLVSRAGGAGERPGLVALATVFAGSVDGAPERRVRGASGAGDHLALTLSPEAVRDGIACRFLADALGTDRAGLCPACGTGTVSLKDRYDLPVVHRLDLTRVDVAFLEGRVRLSGEMSGAGPGFEAAGGFVVDVTFTLGQAGGATELLAHASVVHVDLAIDTEDVVDFLTFGATQALASQVAAIAEVHLRVALAEVASRGPVARVALPDLEGLDETWTSVNVSPDGLSIVGRVAGRPRTVVSPEVAILGEPVTTYTEVARGTAGATCARSGYAYVDNDAEVTHFLRVAVTGTARAYRVRWLVSGLEVPAAGGTLTFATANTGRGADANDGRVSLSASFDGTGTILALRNRPSDGNFAVNVVALVEDGVDVYTDVKALSFDGQPRVWPEEYFHDLFRCMQKTVPVERRFRWPASDPADWDLSRWGGLLGGVPGLPGGRPGGRPGVPGVPGLPGELGFARLAGGYVRTAAGELHGKALLPAEVRAALADPDAFRVAPVAPVDARPADLTEELRHVRDLARVGLFRGGRIR